jgi:PPOX class probable F420-dependent enzyme
MVTPQERARVSAARVARLATVRPDGTPHIVAVTFALDGDTVISAVDHKPKRTQELQRLRNLQERPRASLLVDHYEENWSKLWWVRLDVDTEIVRDERRRSDLLAPLIAKYGHYRIEAPQGPVVLMRIRSSASWSASARAGVVGDT